MMSQSDPKLLDLILKKYKDRFLILMYKKGYGGHLISRIIKSSSQYYCNEKDPIRFPDSTEGFPVLISGSLDFKTQENVERRSIVFDYLINHTEQYDFYNYCESCFLPF